MSIIKEIIEYIWFRTKIVKPMLWKQSLLALSRYDTKLEDVIDYDIKQRLSSMSLDDKIDRNVLRWVLLGMKLRRTAIKSYSDR